MLKQRYEVQIVYWVLTQYFSTASWLLNLELGQEAIYNNQIISVRPCQWEILWQRLASLARKMALKKRMSHIQDIPYVGRHPPPKSLYIIYPFNLPVIHPLGMPWCHPELDKTLKASWTDISGSHLGAWWWLAYSLCTQHLSMLIILLVDLKPSFFLCSKSMLVVDNTLPSN